MAMRLLSSARHKWLSKDDGRETLVDAAGAPPGFPLVPIQRMALLSGCSQDPRCWVAVAPYGW